MKNARIIYMSSSEFGLLPLMRLAEMKHTIVGVYTKPEASRDRGQKVSANPIFELCKTLHLPVFKAFDMNDDSAKNFWHSCKPNLAIVAGFGHILPDFYLKPQYGCWNIHASILPRWRGAAPIERAILAGDRETGVSIMRVVSALDAGPVIAQKSINMENLSSQELHKNISALGAELMVEVLHDIVTFNFQETPQNESLVTYAQKIEKSEYRIEWRKSRNDIYRQILAFSGKAWCLWRDRRLIVHAAKRISTKDAKFSQMNFTNKILPGIIVHNPLVVACDDGYMELIRVQLEGRRVVTAEEFCRGYGVELGEVLI